MKHPALVWILGLVGTNGPLAAELELDTTFGGGGTVTLPQGETLGGSAWGYVELPLAVQVMADGRVLYAGNDEAGKVRLLRLGADGRLDPSFGGSGRVDLPLGASSNGTSPGIAIDAQGRILVAGAAPPGKDAGGADLPPRARVLRVAADGTLDTRFGEAGFADQAIAGAEGPPRAVRLALDSQQRIRVVASCDAVARDSLRACAVQSWRLLADGKADASFAVSALPGPGGNAPNLVVSFPIAIAVVDGDASFVLVEEPEDLMDNFERLLRIGADGRVDTAFDSGTVGNQVNTIFGAGRALYVARTLSDQRLYGYTASILKLEASGTPDRSFGSNGSLALESVSSIGAVAPYFTALAPDGPDTIVAAGYSRSFVQLAPSRLFARISLAGAGGLDRGFGRNGYYQLPIGAPTSGIAALRRDQAGRLVFAGIASSQLRLGVPTVSRVLEGPTLPGVSPGIIGIGEASNYVGEQVGVLRVRVIRAGGARGAASVEYSTFGLSATEGGDFRAARGRLDWADGDFGDRFVDIPIVDDTTPETQENLRLSLDIATGAALAAQPSISITIIDDDPAPQAAAPTGGGAVASPGASGGGGAADAALLLALAAWLGASLRRFNGRRPGRATTG